MSSQLSDKVILVSGGARGIGEAYARGIVAAGGKVIIGDILDSEGRQVADSLGKAAKYVHLDVTSQESWESALKEGVSTFSKITGLVNNAGISASNSTVADEPIEVFESVVKVNLVGVYTGIHLAIPYLRSNGSGSIVNISSAAGLVGLAMTGGYGAAKWGVRGLTKIAAIELGRENIRVNSIHPGMIMTAMTAVANLSAEVGDFPAAPLQRVGSPEELVAIVCYLLSDDASYVTGAEIAVDGGWTTGITV